MSSQNLFKALLTKHVVVVAQQRTKKINTLPNLQSSSSSHITFDNTTSISNCEGVNFVKELWDAVQYRSFDDKDNDLEKDDNDFRAFLYDLDEVHEVVAKKFEQAEKSNKLANFVFEVELDKDLLDIFDLNQQDLANITNLKIIKQRFQQLANIFIIPLESGSNKLIDPEIHTVGQSLGFLTPLFKYIGTKKATEIIIDSTFKTNQERFEIFVVNLNCGGYGMPIAYLYLTTLNFTEKDLHNSGNHHVKCAIDKRIKDKSKATTYTNAKALEAHNQFNFIDLLWVQNADWIKAIVAEINPDADKKYHINIEKWKSCQLLIHSIQSIVDNSIEEENMSLNDLQNILMKVYNDTIEKRKEKCARYRKKFEIALTLYER
ncbi:40539_t:CDS:2, partial [Gigaspora margarita]